jgi:hypothetical protein
VAFVEQGWPAHNIWLIKRWFINKSDIQRHSHPQRYLGITHNFLLFADTHNPELNRGTFIDEPGEKKTGQVVLRLPSIFDPSRRDCRPVLVCSQQDLTNKMIHRDARTGVLCHRSRAWKSKAILQSKAEQIFIQNSEIIVVTRRFPERVKVILSNQNN